LLIEEMLRIMGLNDKVSAERVHIGFFGLRNAGKSSIVNAITGQDLVVVSDVKGTTTDPVKKAMEILPLGPVVIIDTPGIDDEGELGELRVQKAKKILTQTDVAVLVVDALRDIQEKDRELIKLFETRNIPYIIVYNKSDLLKEHPKNKENIIWVSAKENHNIHELKELIAQLVKIKENNKRIVGDLLLPEDKVILVVPIDESAPKGRLILPQQQTIREILDSGCTAIVCRDSELKETLNSLKEMPKLVITDSQVFEKVAKDIPREVMLTSFSILFARYKGNLDELVKGATKLKELKEGDKVLISEGCTHHRQCNDIGTVKMPKWIENYTGKRIEFSFTSGGDFPEDLSQYDLIVHCGGCMLNEKEMQYRIEKAKENGIPMVNYGVAIAQMHGILERSLEVFRER